MAFRAAEPHVTKGCNFTKPSFSLTLGDCFSKTTISTYFKHGWKDCGTRRWRPGTVVTEYVCVLHHQHPFVPHRKMWNNRSKWSYHLFCSSRYECPFRLFIVFYVFRIRGVVYFRLAQGCAPSLSRKKTCSFL